ncbi:MAG: hypothetical protein IH941_10390 [Acidobacteria bacterium]|nr:hypothetical protein [Acidobacteriota bacterium]
MTIRRRRILFPLLMAVLLMALASGVALGKAHVPAGDVQVSHKGRTAINVDAPALAAHLGHGDIQLPACDFANVFGEGTDTSNVVDAEFVQDGVAGVLYLPGTGPMDATFVPRDDAGGITPACPTGTF